MSVMKKSAANQLVAITCPRSRFYVHLPKDRSESVNKYIALLASAENYFLLVRHATGQLFDDEIATCGPCDVHCLPGM